MSQDTAPYADWIGAKDTAEDEISLFPALALAATLDDTETQFGIGSSLPPIWQWFYFLPKAPQSKLGRTAIPNAVVLCRPSSCRGECSPAPA